MQIIKGLIVVVLVSIGGILLSHLSGMVLDFENTPFSPILICILLGIIINHFFDTSSKYQYVTDFGIKYVLKWGIVLLGIGISLVKIIQISAQIIPIVVITIASGILLALFFAKLFKIDHTLFMLIGLGTAICGATAIAAASPVIQAKKEHSAYAISVIALFGTIAMAIYPYLANYFFTDPLHLGVFLGTSIHDTSQVLGAGLIYSQQFDSPKVLDITIVTKLIRNSFMIVAIPAIAYLNYRHQKKNFSSGSSGKLDYKKVFPLFILGFLGLAFLRSIVDYGIEQEVINNTTLWQDTISTINFIAKKICLVFAMTCIGLSTSIKNLYTIGLKPFFVGFAIAVLLAIVNTISIHGLL